MAKEYTAQSMVIRKLSESRLSFWDHLKANAVADSVDWEVYVPDPTCSPEAPMGAGCRIDVVVDGKSIVEIKEWGPDAQAKVASQLARYRRARPWELNSELNDEEWIDSFIDTQCGLLHCEYATYVVWAPPNLDGHIYYAELDKAPKEVRERVRRFNPVATIWDQSHASLESKMNQFCSFICHGAYPTPIVAGPAELV